MDTWTKTCFFVRWFNFDPYPYGYVLIWESGTSNSSVGFLLSQGKKATVKKCPHSQGLGVRNLAVTCSCACEPCGLRGSWKSRPQASALEQLPLMLPLLPRDGVQRLTMPPVVQVGGRGEGSSNRFCMAADIFFLATSQFTGPKLKHTQTWLPESSILWTKSCKTKVPLEWCFPSRYQGMVSPWFPMVPQCELDFATIHSIISSRQ